MTIVKPSDRIQHQEQRVRDRVRGRKLAAHAFEGVDVMASTHELTDGSLDLQDGFFDELEKRCGYTRDAAAEPELSDVIPIARLGSTVLPFGKYHNHQFDYVPLDYLEWLCRSQEEFLATLKAYMKHPELESRRRGLDE